ncbi:MAG: MFS transporter [Mangrovimonas sp.]|nr:MFS transporter [Mangrovimonas sp.]MCB0470198.1 MFS transporter [Flavobacteriaceae bacterium]
MEAIKKNRLALGAFFFIYGFNFATWTSRIPTIKEVFNLNDAQLGSILMIMPVSSITGLAVSGWMVSKFENRIPIVASTIILTLSLLFIASQHSVIMLVVGIGLFAFFMRILNISANTQSLYVQKFFNKNIVGSFHGLWSLGGVCGVLFSTLMVKNEIALFEHFITVSIVTIVMALLGYRFLIQNDKSVSGNKLIFGKPDKYIMMLGIMVFLAAISEGGMFDWSGVYFKDVLKSDVFTYGYLIFMSCMALSRFLSDYFLEIIGIRRTYFLSGAFVFLGTLISVLFPSFYVVLVGFCLIGFGTAAIFPLTFSMAGKSTKYSPGMAISIVATYSTIGFLIGPPLIGYLSYMFSLRYAFLLLSLMGFLMIPVSKLFFDFQDKQNDS